MHVSPFELTPMTAEHNVLQYSSSVPKGWIAQDGFEVGFQLLTRMILITFIRTSTIEFGIKIARDGLRFRRSDPSVHEQRLINRFD